METSPLLFLVILLFLKGLCINLFSSQQTYAQSASYAAATYSYVSQKLGVVLTVPGPGAVHALPGLLHAATNKWPLLHLSGAPKLSRRGCGAFMEAPQREAASIFAETYEITKPEEAANVIMNACTKAVETQRGVFVELPQDVLESGIDTQEQEAHTEESKMQTFQPFVEPPKEEDINSAFEALKRASRPLFVFGKGAAYSQAEEQGIFFIEYTQTKKMEISNSFKFIFF